MSAFLLFLVQPLIARQILPWFGGTSSAGHTRMTGSGWCVMTRIIGTRCGVASCRSMRVRSWPASATSGVERSGSDGPAVLAGDMCA